MVQLACAFRVRGVKEGPTLRDKRVASRHLERTKVRVRYTIHPRSRALSLAAHHARPRNSDKVIEARGSSSIGIRLASSCGEFAGL
jgi:hypothetical protein